MGEQWVRIRMLLYSQIKGFKDRPVIIALANGKGNNVSAFQIKNCTELSISAHLCLYPN